MRDEPRARRAPSARSIVGASATPRRATLEQHRSVVARVRRFRFGWRPRDDSIAIVAPPIDVASPA
jgi:hypothetical protein